MSTIAERLRAIAKLQPTGTRVIDKHNSYDHDSRAPASRSVASDNRGGKHPWRQSIPERRSGKRAAK